MDTADAVGVDVGRRHKRRKGRFLFVYGIASLVSVTGLVFLGNWMLN